MSGIRRMRRQQSQCVRSYSHRRTKNTLCKDRRGDRRAEDILRHAAKPTSPHGRSGRRLVRAGKRARGPRPGFALFSGLGHLKTSEVSDGLEREVRRIESHLDRCGLLGTRTDDLDPSGDGDPESNLATGVRDSPPLCPRQVRNPRRGSQVLRRQALGAQGEGGDDRTDHEAA